MPAQMSNETLEFSQETRAQAGTSSQPTMRTAPEYGAPAAM
jgi:hypothetical protein